MEIRQKYECGYGILLEIQIVKERIEGGANEKAALIFR